MKTELRAALISGLVLLAHGCGLMSRGPSPEAVNHDEAVQEPAFALMDPGNIDQIDRWATGQVRRTQTPLSPAEAGYYMDVLEAQLHQKLGTGIVHPVREGDTILLRISGPSAFDTNRSRLNPDGHAALHPIAGVLSEFRKTLVIINSHTDAAGNAAFNQRLSEQRAIAVAHYLVDQGVPPERIAAIGLGESSPLDSPGTDKINRRIDIRLKLIVDSNAN